MADTKQPLRTYRGNCHCGAFVYEINVPEVKSVAECNCSICYKKGYIRLFLEKKNFRVAKGDITQLSSYTFGGKRAEHQFCATCGTGIMRTALTDECPPSMELGINVHSIQGINTWALEIKECDGRSHGSTYEPPAHKGALPEAESDGSKLYTGGCHCGKVTLAVKCKPIDEKFDQSTLVVCNCSVCERGGYIWLYPFNDQVVLAGEDADIGYYLFGRRVMGKTFCRTCGVHLTNRFNADILKKNLELTKMPEPTDDDEKKWQFSASKKHPVNLRALDGVDLGRLTLRRIKTASQPPLYVNP